jgi:serine/threonine-protein kinase
VDIFVSYKAEDRARLVPLVEALEAEGFSVWWDTHIGGGAHWREDIQDHLDTAKCVIVAWTKKSVGLHGNFVRDEASRAQRRGVYLPVRFDPVEPPLGFGEIQAISLKGWHGDRTDPRFVALADAVRECITGEPMGRHRAHHEKAGVSRRTLVGGGIGAAVVAGVGGWLLLKPAPANAKRIAVLPFENLSVEREQAYFAEGVAGELRAALSRIGLQVIGRNSCEAVKDLDIKTAAAKLDAANILTGSVRRSPDTIRVNAQLVSGRDGVERWAQTYDRAPGDSIKIQSDIAANVAQALSFALGQTNRAALTIGGTSNPRAQDLLLQATAAVGRDDSEKGTLATISLLDRAIALDPNYAEAHARRSQYVDLWASQFSANVANKDRALADAIRSAQRAIAIAPQLSLGYGALAGIHQDQLQLKRSLFELQRADALPGVEIVTLVVYALVLSQSRHQPEALSMIDRAIALDPLNPLAPELKSWILFFGRQYEAAAVAARRALALEPRRLRSTAYLGNALIMLGRTDEARRQFQGMPADDYRRLVGEAVIAAREGRKQDALKAIPAIERRYGDAAYYQFAQVYAQAGLIDQAVQALETSWAKRDPGLATIQVDPFIDPVRKDARLSAIAARVFD